MEANKITTLPPIIRMSDTYKLIVPQEVEAKIRYLIRKFPHNEWSGILFTTYEGTFEDHNLVITCKDIFPMASGSGGWTEFTMNEDVAAYMAENLDLFNCEQMLIHSHHTLGAFFSGQDVKTLQDQGNDKNCFVSLIVDTRGQYVAAITRKVHSKKTVTTNILDGEYEFFGEGTKTLSKGSETSTEIEDTVIQYFMLDVERHEVDNPLAYLDDRFEEIEARSTRLNTAEEINKKLGIARMYDPNNIIPSPEEVSQYRQKQAQQLDLFKEAFADDGKPSSYQAEYDRNVSEFEEIYRNVSIDENALKAAVARILCCSLIINPDKVDLKQWVTRNMEKVYRNLFESGEEAQLDTSFEEYADGIIEWTILHFPMVDYPATLNPDLYDMESLEYAIVARAIEERMLSYGSNKYIKYYCKELERYTNEMLF